MTTWTLVRRSLLRRKARLAFTLLAVSVAFLLFAVTSAIRQNFSADGTPDAASRLIVMNATGLTATLPLNAYDRAARVEGVADSTFRVLAGGYFRDRKNAFLMIGADPRAYLRMFPELLASPREREDFARDRGTMVVGETLAGRFGWAVGDTVPILLRPSLQSDGTTPIKLRIAGIITGAKRDVGTGMAIMHFDTLDGFRLLGKGTISNVVLRSRRTSDNDAVASAVDALFRNSPDETSTTTEESFARALVSQIANIALITTLVAGCGFFAILMIVGSSFSASVRERAREIATLRILGFSSRRVFLLLVGEAVAVTVAGGAIGMILGGAVTRALKASDAGTYGRLMIGWDATALAATIMVLFGVAIALFPTWSVNRADIATALQRR